MIVIGILLVSVYGGGGALSQLVYLFRESLLNQLFNRQSCSVICIVACRL